MPNTDTDWRAGNAFGGGYINDVRFHPTDPNRVLLVTDIGGMHLSTDGGTTWLPRGRAVSDHVAGVACGTPPGPTSPTPWPVRAAREPAGHGVDRRRRELDDGVDHPHRASPT